MMGRTTRSQQTLSGSTILNPQRRPALKPSAGSTNISKEGVGYRTSKSKDNVEIMLTSPTTTKRRVKSQERTPTRQVIALSETVDDLSENLSQKQDDHMKTMEKSFGMHSDSNLTMVANGTESGVEFEEIAIDVNCNSVHRSPSERLLLNQLQTSLTPKMTEVNHYENRRVSRYGRHQKQKENINYVPADVMKFINKRPANVRQKKDIVEFGLGATDLNNVIELKSGENVKDQEQNIIKDVAKDSKPTSISSAVKDASKQLLGMDSIKIIGMDVSFSSADHMYMEGPIQKKNNTNHTSDAASAKGSSIDLDCYSTGEIYWAAQKMSAVHWPCIIRVDPETNQVTRNHTDGILEIHVAFFGDRGRRGWIRESYMVPFDGFESYCLKAEKLEFGKLVKSKMRSALQKQNWKHASELAEDCFNIEIGQRLEHFDMQVNLQKMQITSARLMTQNKKGQNKRGRSTTPESPEYEALPQRAKILRTEQTMNSSLHTKFHGETNNAKTEEHKGQVETAETFQSGEFAKAMYSLLLNIGRMFLINGQISGKQEDLLQHYAREMIMLKLESHHKVKRTAILQELAQLRKLCQFVEDLMGDGSGKNSEASLVRMKKDKLTLANQFIFQIDPKIITKNLPKGFVCYVCKLPQNVFKCIQCLRHMHIGCTTDDESKQIFLQGLANDKRFKCGKCLTDAQNMLSTNQKCSICNDASDDTKNESKYRCMDNSCSRQYHLSCLRLFPQYAMGNSNTIVCPYHVCHTCVSDDPRGKASITKTALLQCLMCPSSYHPDIRCVPAGSELLTTQQLICPRHSLEQVALNVNWCFFCCKGGNLICCETCPNAFHRDCLPFTVPEGKYFCEECESGRLPLYNEIVIVKFGSFRWWPALILPPSEISDNLLQQRPHASSVCVKFFQSHTVAWSNRRRMYLYQHDDSENLGTKKSGSLDKQYRIAMAEASNIYEIMQKKKTSRFVQKQKMNAPIYTKIKVNQYIAPLRITTANTDSSCSCRADDDDPCGPTSSCINRAIMIECMPKTCPAKERCMNQRFAKRNYPPLEVRYFAGKGYGLVAKERIESGQFVIEYVGEVINSEEFRKRMQSAQEQKFNNYYFLTVDSDMTIDAGSKGNMSRFINHSCDPNCETQKWTIGNNRVIGLFAIKEIQPGEEVTFNYYLDSMSNEKRVCLCGTDKCSGFIGEKYRPPKTTSIVINKKRSMKGIIKRTNASHTKKGSRSQHKRFENEHTFVKHAAEADVMIKQDADPETIDLENNNDHDIPVQHVVIKTEIINDNF